MIERLASLGLDEFRAHLPYALRDRPHRWLDAQRLEIDAEGVSVLVSVEEVEPLALSGVLRLPRLRITLAFTGGDEASQTTFLAAWDRAFQRGGG